MPPITKETFTWFSKDPEWKNKFLIGSLMFLAGYIVPIIGWLGMFVALGYSLAIWRAQLRGETPVLSQWDKYEINFLDGLKATLASFLYYLPPFVASAAAFLFLFSGIAFAVFTTSGLDRAASIAAWTPLLTGYLGFFVTFLLAGILSLIAAIPCAIAVGQYVRTGKISAGYRFGEIRRIFRANASGFIGALVALWGVGIGLSIVIFLLYFTVILCLLNQFVVAPVLFYQTVMWTYLFGSAYREGCVKAGIVLDTPAK